MSTETKPGIVEMIARVLDPEAFADPLVAYAPGAASQSRESALVTAAEILTVISGSYCVVPLSVEAVPHGYIALVKPDGSRKTNDEIRLEAAVMRGELPEGTTL